MSKKNKSRDAAPEAPKLAVHSLKKETVNAVIAIIFLVIALFFFLSSIHRAGYVGNSSFQFFTYLMGIGYFLLPTLFCLLGISFLKILEKHFVLTKIIGSMLFFFSGLGIINLLSHDRGGVIGKIISTPLVKLFDVPASFLFLIAFATISLLVIFDTHIQLKWALSIFERKKKSEEVKISEETMRALNATEEPEGKKKEPAQQADEEESSKEKPRERETKITQGSDKLAKASDSGFLVQLKSYSGKPYIPPPLSLLEQDKGKPGVGDIKANANIIKRTLQNFGIDVEMDEISIGPSVTRYSLKPAEGVKLSRILALQNDLSLALAAHPIRIEAPIPGKSLVGIEIPNTTKTTVGLGTLLNAEEYRTSEKALLVALGKGISGKSHFVNVAKMPHLLIAGTTGSGKSVTIHTLITSLLYRNSPESLKFIMIDPKRVELTLYNKIPHLLTPVITDAKKAILALKWAAKEMDRRYDILESQSVRDIESYHKNVLAPLLKKDGTVPTIEGTEGQSAVETMPYIIVIIDELADIMTSYPRELEAAIVRLAQMSRAVGIHLFLSTQRPSVNVITGLIKANIPSRLALQVSSQIDSRTILDTSGAEKLLGAGDMLFLSGEMSKPQRIQSAFISEKEVKNVVKYLVDAYWEEVPTEINLAGAEHESNPLFESSLEGGDGDDDELYEEAREIVLKAGKASTSYIQRKLRVGYARAARLVDLLEERGVIGGADGAKPREVIGGDSSGSSDESETPSDTA